MSKIATDAAGRIVAFELRSEDRARARGFHGRLFARRFGLRGNGGGS
jgi:hypothetical protein